MKVSTAGYSFPSIERTQRDQSAVPGSVRSGSGGGTLFQSGPSSPRTFTKGENTMDITGLRADATGAAFDAFAIDVELLQGGSIAETKTVGGIWTQPTTQTELGGFDVQSDRPSYVLALKKADAPKVTRGDRVRAEYGGRLRRFRVDGPLEIFSDHYRLQLVPDDTTAPPFGPSGKSIPDHKPPPDRKPTDDSKPPGPDPHEVKDHE